LDHNSTIYGKCAKEWMQIKCFRSILAKFSQTSLYNIQTTKHT
jgi:hypothetical protein